jgi:hypothetical protein
MVGAEDQGSVLAAETEGVGLDPGDVPGPAAGTPEQLVTPGTRDTATRERIEELIPVWLGAGWQGYKEMDSRQALKVLVRP